jgi:hypothetical protein
VTVLADAPSELQVSIMEFWPDSEWDNAASVAKLESNFDAFALRDTTDADHPCGAVLGVRGRVNVTAERSIGYFQINACNYPEWEWQRLYNARHNAGTAHALWESRGWGPWYFSASELGLL